MHRRLNPQLFDSVGGNNVSEKADYSAIANKKMAEEVLVLKKSVSHLESQVEVLRGQLAQFTDRTEKRTDRISKAMTQVEQQDRQANLEILQKVRTFETNLKESRVIDGKIENMVDRYNMSLRQFENRLTSLQKVISEKEMTLMRYNSALETIFKELEKMKKEKLQSRSV